MPLVSLFLQTEAAADVAAERIRQDIKWGQQNHEPLVWLAVLGEEVGEANQAVLKATYGGKPWSDYRDELVHTAAVALAAIECLDRHNGQPTAQPTDLEAAPDA